MIIAKIYQVNVYFLLFALGRNYKDRHQKQPTSKLHFFINDIINLLKFATFNVDILQAVLKISRCSIKNV